jgi:hypothetical protein
MAASAVDAVTGSDRKHALYASISEWEGIVNKQTGSAAAERMTILLKVQKEYRSLFGDGKGLLHKPLQAVMEFYKSAKREDAARTKVENAEKRAKKSADDLKQNFRMRVTEAENKERSHEVLGTQRQKTAASAAEKAGRAAANAAKVLCLWVKAMRTYHSVAQENFKSRRPLEEQLAEVQGKWEHAKLVYKDKHAEWNHINSDLKKRRAEIDNEESANATAKSLEAKKQRLAKDVAMRMKRRAKRVEGNISKAARKCEEERHALGLRSMVERLKLDDKAASSSAQLLIRQVDTNDVL